MFGIPINLTYNGKESFKTLFGATVSAITFIVIFSFFIYRSCMFISKDSATISTIKKVSNLHQTGPFYLQNFNLVFTSNMIPDPTIG